MRTKPLLISLIAIGISVAALPARADRDSTGAGIVIGGTIGAVAGGPPGWILGMMLGAAIGEGEATRNARVNGEPVYATAPVPPSAVYLPPHASVPVTRVAPPPPGFYGVPSDYRAPRPAYTVVQHAPVQYAPRVVYPAPVYYAPPRRYYRPYYY